MLKKINQSILFIIFLFLSGSALEIFGQTKRDLNNYIKGPTFSYVWNLSDEEEENLRKYIWDAWNKKQQVYFYMSFNTREGDINISVYYIEKGKNNSWRLVTKIEQGQCPYISKEDCQKLFATEWIYDRVEKVQKRNGYKIVISKSDSKNKEKLEF